MRVRRGLLFWGLFLIPLGTIPLLVRGGALSADQFDGVWRWWPVLLIGIGLAILLGRGKAGLVGTVVVALVLGSLGGGALASGNLWFGAITECGSGGTTSEIDRSGTFTGDASVTVDLDCGTVDLSVAPGSDWRAQARYRGPEPRVDATGSALVLGSPSGAGAHRQEWTIVTGADALHDLDLGINAGSASARLAGAALDRVSIDLNAGDLLLDGDGATIDRLDASVNAGRIRVTLDGASSGSLSSNAGSMELCVPADAQLRFEVREQLTFATNLQGRGLTRDGDVWTRAGSGGLIALAVEGNAASFTLDPEGGCK